MMLKQCLVIMVLIYACLLSVSASASVSEGLISGLIHSELKQSEASSEILSSPQRPLQVQQKDLAPVSHYALAVFFISTCPHCARFLPIVKDAAKTHGLPVYAISMDGAGTQDFPYPLAATAKVREHFGFPQTVPSLYLVDQDDVNRKPLLLAQGEETAAELEGELSQLAFH